MYVSTSLARSLFLSLSLPFIGRFRSALNERRSWTVTRETKRRRRRSGRERGRRRRKRSDRRSGHPSPPRCGLASFGKRVRTAAVELRQPIRKCLLLEVGERGSFETGRSGYWLGPATRGNVIARRKERFALEAKAFCSPNRIEGRRGARKGKKRK